MNRKKGNRYEAQAELLLTQSGLTFIERNISSRFGEIDLIFQDHDCLVFVEVRFRKQAHFGSAEQTVDFRKQQKIIKTALDWMTKKKINSEMQAFRFDVMAMNERCYEWIQNAFNASTN